MTTRAWNKTLVTASALVCGQGTEFGGISCSTAGTNTTATVYDATTATGDPVLPTTGTLTTGLFVSPVSITATVGPPANGVQMTTGLYVAVGGTGSPKLYCYWR